MERLFRAGEGATALQNNIAYTTGIGGDYWKSGLKVTPNTTDTSGIYVDVDAGVARINDSDVSYNAQKVGPLSAASNDPYIAVIYADVNEIDAYEGGEAARQPAGASFPNLWEPAPDDGGNIPGIARATVIVDPSVSDSTDLTAGDIRNYNASGAGDFVAEDDLEPSIEALDVDLTDPLETAVDNTLRLGGTHHNQWRSDTLSIDVPGQPEVIPGTDNSEPPQRKFLTVPPDHRFTLWRTSLNSNTGALENDITIQVVRDTASGQVEVFSTGATYEYGGNAGALASVAAQDTAARYEFRFQNANAADSARRYTALFRCQIADTTF
jgi:hypothetical protein